MNDPVQQRHLNANKSYLIDSSIYIFRSWFVLPDDLLDPQGHQVNALYGFTDFVYQLLSQEQPTHIAFAFDQSLNSSYRNDIYPAYKANRESAPAELKRQFKYCQEFIKALGITGYVSERYEADDIIGVLRQDAHKNGRQSIIVTADKDLTQLVGSDDIWWDFAKNNRMTPREIEKKFGVKPEQIADLLAITGDKVDNIPGVPGVGTKTAARLLTKFGDITNLLDNTSAISEMKFRGAKRVMTLIEDHVETIILAKKLTLICCNKHDVLKDKPSTQRTSADQNLLRQFFTERGFSPARQARWFRLLSNQKD